MAPALIRQLKRDTARTLGRNPAEVMVDWAGRPVTAAELLERLQAECAWFEAWRAMFKDGSSPCIAHLAPDGLPLLISTIACLLSGVRQAIVPHDASSVERASLAQRYGLTHWLVGQAWQGRTSELAGEGDWEGAPASPEQFDVVPLSAGLQSDGSPEAHAAFGEAEEALLLSTTSGTSSGRPGINRTTASQILSGVQRLDWSPYQLLHRPLLGPGLQHHSSRLFKLTCVMQGTGLVVRDPLAPIGPDVLAQGCTGTPMAPLALRRRLEAGQLDRLPGSFLVVTGADRVPMALREAVRRLHSCSLGITYATSQCGPISWLSPEALLDHREGLGHPLDNVRLALIGAPRLQRDGLGFHEVLVSKVTRWQVEREGGGMEVQQAVQEPFNPNDLIARSADGALIFGGRSNDVFLFSSLLISPLEIEDVLRADPRVRDCVAFGANSEHYGAVPMAAVVLQPRSAAGSGDGETATLLAALMERCRTALGPRRPHRIVPLEALPLGPTGKPLRRVLAERFALRS
ncbi:hypothetical protein CPCC7001_1505 [Cyanobium sp. PCC 7001]|uniref:AMP-binding enzyme n=1 Tax=Cyanobium sp. PCC 7001 TaxID=180281 RepID=UPI00018051B2|nr:class I adenylate-forming enzyme family protein [Cyanobium sp. PCC 7001]EDY38626.1 hypothetical protein CPCC7001_1505 [Cyanobium sp. PCC 7001]